jgi:hypothetical protein
MDRRARGRHVCQRLFASTAKGGERSFTCEHATSAEDAATPAHFARDLHVVAGHPRKP